MSKPEYIKELENAGCEIHREYQDGSETIYIVEKRGSFAKMKRMYNKWYEVKSGSSLMHEEDWTDYRLKTRAKSANGQYQYTVTIQKGFNDREWTLSIDETPATWYLSTLFEDFDPEQKTISIYGRDWICENYNEVMKEVVEHLGEHTTEKFIKMKGDW